MTKRVYLLNGLIIDPADMTPGGREMFEIAGFQMVDVVDDPVAIEQHLQSDEVTPVGERTHSG